MARAHRLLDESADLQVRDLRDNLNRTPREIALMRGFVDVAGEFVPRTQNVSMARFLKDRN